MHLQYRYINKFASTKINNYVWSMQNKFNWNKKCWFYGYNIEIKLYSFV